MLSSFTFKLVIQIVDSTTTGLLKHLNFTGKPEQMYCTTVLICPQLKLT